APPGAHPGPPAASEVGVPSASVWDSSYPLPSMLVNITLATTPRRARRRRRGSRRTERCRSRPRWSRGLGERHETCGLAVHVRHEEPFLAVAPGVDRGGF